MGKEGAAQYAVEVVELICMQMSSVTTALNALPAPVVLNTQLTHLTGAWHVLPLPCHPADENCLKVPAGMTDNQVLFLTDILPTAWHANELGEVGPGDVVAIWGAGPGEVPGGWGGKRQGDMYWCRRASRGGWRVAGERI